MTTQKTGLTETANGQANYLNVNAALAQIDQLMQAAALDKDLSAPPGSPSNGALYIIGSSPTGAWSGHANHLAYWLNSIGVWTFVVPLEGWLIHVNDEDAFYKFDGSNWILFSTGGGGSWSGGTVSQAINEAPPVTLASASTVNIGAAAANTINVTGTATITAFDTIAAGAVRRVVFSGILTLTHNATSLILPGAANITTAAGDVAELVSLGSGNWRCFNYAKASGQAVAGGSGGLTRFTEGRSATSPNATIPVVSLVATDTASNADVSFVPKGSGAKLGHIPDGTATGGNKRGTYATDWQTGRSGATQVASGAYSGILAGTDNTASGDYSAVVVGSLNSATGLRAVIVGGNQNSASGQYAFIGGGWSNTASASFATIPGGYQNFASGQYSYIPGGYQATVRGIYGAEARASGAFALAGDSQRGRHILRRSTTNATAMVLTSDAGAPGAANQAVMPEASCFTFRAYVSAIDSNRNVAGFEIKGVVKRDFAASSVAFAGTPTSTSLGASASASSWTAVASVDTTNGALQITVTGAASTTIRWTADLETVEVAN